MKSTYTKLCILLGGMVLFLSGCGGSGPLGLGAPPTPTALPPVVASTNVTAEGRLVPASYATLTFAANGEVDQLLAAEGQQVQKGALLASLGKREPVLAALAAARLEQTGASQQLSELKRKADLAYSAALQVLLDDQKPVNEAQLALDEVNTRDFKKQIDDKEVIVQDNLTKLKDEQDALDKLKNLAEDNQKRVDAQKKVDDAQKAYDTAVRDRDALQYRLDSANAALTAAKNRRADAQYAVDQRKNGPDPDQLALAQARLDNAAAQVAAAQRALDNMDLRAPFDGTVIDLNKALKPGVWVTAAQPMLTLVDFSQWYVETKDLTEMDVVKVEKGQKVTFTPDALLDLKFPAVVESISSSFTEKSGDVLYTVRIRTTLATPDLRLRWGMTVKVTFEK
jgi:multidrug resistance efflux pump